MRLKNYIDNNINENVFQDMLKKVASKPNKMLEKMFKDNWKKLAGILQDNQLEKDALQIINKHLNTQYKSLNQISKSKIASMPARLSNEEVLVEDFSHWWELIKSESFPALSFFPALQAWLEIDKMIRASSVDLSNLKVIGVYGLFWALLVSGKFIKGWHSWKKKNPKEWEKEGSRKNPVSLAK